MALSELPMRHWRQALDSAVTCIKPLRSFSKGQFAMAQAPKTTKSASSSSKSAPGIRRVAVIGGNRTPFARSNTAYSKISNQELLTSTLRGLVDRYNLQGMRLGEVVAGAVIKHSRDFNLTRESVLSSGLAPETPAYDIQQACGTGLEAAILVANKIALG